MPPVKNAPLNVVVLAAGKGTRMFSRLPKVLHALGGKPLLAHVLDRARALHADRTIVIYGHGGDAVPKAFADPALEFVLQEPQLGTGHAVQQALPHLLPGGATLILYGDVPLTRHQTLLQLTSNPAELSLLTALLDDPTGYGRIVRDQGGAIARIVEERDASAKEKTIREINTGMVCAPTARLGEWLARLTNRNAQKEYYLTDIVSLAITTKTPVTAVQPSRDLGNSRRQQQGTARLPGAGLSAGMRTRTDAQRRNAGRPVAIRRARRTAVRP